MRSRIEISHRAGSPRSGRRWSYGCLCAPGRRFGVASALVLAVALPASGQPRPSSPGVSDKQIDRAIRRGINYLYKTQSPDGDWRTGYQGHHGGGVAALVVLTAITAGEDVKHPRLAKALGRVDRAGPITVYARAIRAILYARLGRSHHQRLGTDAAWLVSQQQANGGWGYGPGHPTTRKRQTWTDNSNSQLAALALREAAGAGVVVPERVWQGAHKYWSAGQNSDGGWGYESRGRAGGLRQESYGTMTAAGVATLFILATDQARAAGKKDLFPSGGPRSISAADAGAIDRGLVGSLLYHQLTGE